MARKGNFLVGNDKTDRSPGGTNHPRPGKELGPAMSDRVLFLIWISSLVLTGGAFLLLLFI